MISGLSLPAHLKKEGDVIRLICFFSILRVDPAFGSLYKASIFLRFVVELKMASINSNDTLVLRY